MAAHLLNDNAAVRSDQRTDISENVMGKAVPAVSRTPRGGGWEGWRGKAGTGAAHLLNDNAAVRSDQ